MRIRRTTIRIAGARTYPKLAEQVHGSRPCLVGGRNLELPPQAGARWPPSHKLPGRPRAPVPTAPSPP